MNVYLKFKQHRNCKQNGESAAKGATGRSHTADRCLLLLLNSAAAGWSLTFYNWILEYCWKGEFFCDLIKKICSRILRMRSSLKYGFQLLK